MSEKTTQLSKASSITLGDGSYDDVNKVYQGLSDEDKEYVTPGRRVYKDVPTHLLGRTVAYDNDKPVGFADVWGVDNKMRLQMETAVDKDYRGRGLSPQMAQDALRKVIVKLNENRMKAMENGSDPNDKRIKSVLWLLLKGNKASARAAEKAGFKKKWTTRWNKYDAYQLKREDADKMFLGNEKEKKAGAKIDIPALYEDIRRAYADMGYPVSGDRLVLSEQPTYTNGKPVPSDVINPSSSGGNTQDDGTVRINPRYRAVMRHWGLKGPGRDFLRTIIGHELGHHIDKSVLSKPERAEERKRLLREIAKAKFHTVYTDSYGPDTDPRKLDKELLAEYLADMVRRKLEKKAEMSRDRIQAQYARHPQSSLDILAARLAKRKWGPEDVAREYDAHSREYDVTKEDKEFLDRYIIARIGEKYDRKAKIKQALMRGLWEKEHNGESFDAALPYRMARFRQYENIPFPASVKRAAATSAGPVGYRNNNPGNLMSDGRTVWNGQEKVQPKGEWLKFKTYSDGVRAMARTLYNYGKKHDIRTLEKVLKRYDRSVDQSAYLKHVCDKMGLTKDQDIDLTNIDTLQKLVPAMGTFEIGPDYWGKYSPSAVSNAVIRAIPPAGKKVVSSSKAVRTRK